MTAIVCLQHRCDVLRCPQSCDVLRSHLELTIATLRRERVR